MGKYFRKLGFLSLVVSVAVAAALWTTGGGSGVNAQAALTSLDFKSQDAAEIRQAAGASGRTRVIVMLAPEEATTASGAKDEDIDALVAAVKTSVDAVLGDHFGGSASASSGSLGLTRADAHPIFTLNGTIAEIEALAADQRVSSVSLDRAMAISLTQSIPLIGMPAAYANTNATGAGFAVAIFDTGVEWTHQWFTGRLIGEGCFSGGGNPVQSLCPGGAFQSTAPGSGFNCVGNIDCEHGTHVAGIAMGRNQGGAPPNGVARDARLIAYQIFSNVGGNVSSFNSDMVNAYSNLFARRNSFGTPIASINMSVNSANLAFTGNCDAQLPALTAVITSLKNAGIATVISGGNQSHRDKTTFPACITNAIAVANSTKGDQISATSNMSATTTDLVAPGTDITAPIPGNTFGVKTGTSMAAPHVAGIFAALRTACNVPFSAAGVDLILATLRQTGVPIQDQRAGGAFTHPRIRGDIAAAQLCNSGNAPDNNNFADAEQIAAGGTVQGSNVTANKEPGEPAHAGNSGGSSVWWRFDASGAGAVTISTEGSSFDTVLAVYTGGSVDSLTEVVSNDDSPDGGLTSKVSFTATGGTSYFIAVDGFLGLTGNITVVLTAAKTGGFEPLALLGFAGLAWIGRRGRRGK